MKRKILKLIASVALFMSVTYANQASPIWIYSPKLPKKVKDLRKF